jgi:molybdate transport system permease protein
LAFWTTLILLPMGILMGRFLAWSSFKGKVILEVALALPLILPPTVLGFYLLVAFAGTSPFGQFYEFLVDRPLAFSFDGLVLASIIFNLPFAIQPMQRAFEGISKEIREAAACCGLSPWRILWRIELPLAWPGVLSALVLTFAHTIGEFGIILMVGENIPGETQTIAIAIYDRVQLFDNASAGLMSAVLLLVSLVAISATYLTTALVGRRHG